MRTLDRYEKHLLTAFEAGKLKSTVTSEASLRRYREYARATEEGIPYQTLIASVLHKFVAGRFVENSSRLTARSAGRGRKRRAV